MEIQDSIDVQMEPMNDLIIDSIEDIKGNNIVKLDLRHLDEAPTDYFIICEGDSNIQVKAVFVVSTYIRYFPCPTAT